MVCAGARALVLLLCAATASAQIAVTRTADELAAAIKRGAEHILIVSHLDLRGLPVQTTARGPLLFVVPKTVLSITVCSIASEKSASRSECTGPTEPGKAICECFTCFAA